MPNKNLSLYIISSEFDAARCIWFRKSKSFVLLEEPAYSVFQMVAEGKSQTGIIKSCREKYGTLERNIEKFVEEITGYIHYYNDPENKVEVSIKDRRINQHQPEKFHSKISYIIGRKPLTLFYCSQYLEYMVHPVFSHLEAKSPESKNNVVQLFENNNLYYYRFNGKNSPAFKGENMEYFTGTVKQQLFSIIYDKNFNDWMMTLHASGVVKNRKAIIFSAAGGSGKSTLAALLKAQGYGYLSDDLVACDKEGRAYPFPAAMSVKEGALKVLADYYPELKNTESELAHTGKQVRYLSVNNAGEISAAPYPVKALVFVSYKKDADFSFRETGKKEALQILLRETWVNPVPSKVKHFFRWIGNTRFYSLQYSDFAKAKQAIDVLFEDAES